MKIRNFSIIAHIDHGKSTLADRLLEITKSVTKRNLSDRMMDTLELEQEKGITIKLQTARMNWKYTGDKKEYKDKEFVLNLIDTPGHVDFSYEVSRSIAACEGVILLVDAAQGIQAQTMSNFYKALDKDLDIIPIISKVDLDTANIEQTTQDLIDGLDFSEEEILKVSGKTGIGVENLLNKVVERIPAPKRNVTTPTKILIFDSFFHEHKGVVALVKVVQGKLKTEDKLFAIQSKSKIDPIEIGYLRPGLEEVKTLNNGEVGYIATGLKDIRKLHVGDTITKLAEFEDNAVDPLPGYSKPKAMIYSSLYPIDSDDFEQFTDSLERLSLNDAALTYRKETSPVLGSGYCVGFLGLLHLEITQERLSREFGTEIFTTTPSVLYKLDLATDDASKIHQVTNLNYDDYGKLIVRTANEYPRQEIIEKAYEPWLKLEVITPTKYMGGVIELVKKHRGIYKKTEYLSRRQDKYMSNYVLLRFETPTAEIITNFFDSLKSISQGYASMDYENIGYKEADIVKVSILVNYEEIGALAFISHRPSAESKGRRLVEKLSKVIPQQQFKIPIQAAISGKVIARADVNAYKKNVTEKLYGGDYTRKKKLLQKQKKGKKRMKKFGKVNIPKDAFLQILKND